MINFWKGKYFLLKSFWTRKCLESFCDHKRTKLYQSIWLYYRREGGVEETAPKEINRENVQIFHEALKVGTGSVLLYHNQGHRQKREKGMLIQICTQYGNKNSKGCWQLGWGIEQSLSVEAKEAVFRHFHLSKNKSLYIANEYFCIVRVDLNKNV